MNGEEGLSKVSEVGYTKFKEGLELFGVYQYIVKYPGILRALFVNERLPLISSECNKWQKSYYCDVTYYISVL